MRSGSPFRLADRFRTQPEGAASGLLVHPRSLSVAAGIGLATLLVAATGIAVRGPLAGSLQQLGDLAVLPLLGAVVVAALVPATSAAAWRSVFAARGVELNVLDAFGCYGLGSIANTFLPGRAGDALRIELFSRRANRPRGRWFACGVSASVGLAQSLVLAVLLGLGSLTGALPLWAFVPALALPLLLWGAGRVTLRRRPEGRIALLATASSLSAGAWGRLVVWIGVGVIARLTVLVSLLTALSIPRPLPAAVVAMCGLAAGRTIPLTPGVAGLSAVSMALALAGSGIQASTAVAAAVAFHAVETVAALAFGLLSWLAMTGTPLVGRSVSLATPTVAPATD